MPKKILHWLSAVVSILTASISTAYDNSRFPSFETANEGRGFQDISIHPNDEEWLISECTKSITGHPSCHLFFYNLKNETYKRIDLPKTYSYSNGRLSPSGKQILALRQPPPKTETHEDVMKSYAHGEIVIMNRDGGNLHVLPFPANRIMNPVMSPDETRVAYLVAESDKPYVQSVSFAYFEIWEYNLISGENALFAGPMRFYHATTISYISNSEIIAGALAPELIGSTESRDYLRKYKGSEIFIIRRGMRYAPEPIFYDIPFARHPSADDHGNIFFEAQPAKIGFSLVKKSTLGTTNIWRAPRKNLCTVSRYIASPSGNYVGFIYGGDSIASANGKRALGFFDVVKERWYPVSPPPIDESTIVRLPRTH